MAEWTTEDVRRGIIRIAQVFTPAEFQAGAMLDAEAKFDAWLAAHDAEVRAKALEDAAEVWAEDDGLQARIAVSSTEDAVVAAEVWLRDRARAERGEQ